MFMVKENELEGSIEHLIPENGGCSNNEKHGETIAPYIAGILEVELLPKLPPTPLET
jgi:hypothetical protein